MASKAAQSSSFYHWRNPDGTPGGEVSVKADIHPTATIGRFATVLAGAKIGPNEVVPVGHIVEADGTMISFGEAPKGPRP